MATSMQIRILADHTAEPNVHGHLPPTGQIEIQGDPPPVYQFSTTLMERGHVEGWAELINMRPAVLVQEDGGPGAKWAVYLADQIVLHTTDGDVIYKVVRNPCVEDGDVFLGYDVDLEED